MPTTFRWTLIPAAVALASHILVAGQSAPAPSSTSPLSLTASCHLTATGATVQVGLQNRSAGEVSVALGRLVGDQRTEVIDSLVVMTIRAATGANEDFAFVNPRHAMLTGRTQPWTVTIRPGETYQLTAPLAFFISRLTYSLLDPGAVAGTRLLLESRGSRPNVWSGTVETTLDGCQ